MDGKGEKMLQVWLVLVFFNIYNGCKRASFEKTKGGT